MSRLFDASSIGAGAADCAVCGSQTYYRLVVGDGHVPLCEDGCEHAWPRVKAMLGEIAGLKQRLGLIAWWCGADEVSVRREARKRGSDTSRDGGKGDQST